MYGPSPVKLITSPCLPRAAIPRRCQTNGRDMDKGNLRCFGWWLCFCCPGESKTGSESRGSAVYEELAAADPFPTLITQCDHCSCSPLDALIVVQGAQARVSFSERSVAS